MPPAKRARKRKDSGPLGGELRDLPAFATLAESQAEREAFFARAWAQKAARERGERVPAVAMQAQREAEADRARKQSAAEAVARAKRLAELLAEDDL